MSTASQQDPRSVITPDAFDVAKELLGLPLASPGRRFWALMIDLLVIGVVTLVTKSFALVLGVVAAAFFMRAGFKRTPVRGSAFNRAMRASVGCFGFFIAVITASLWWTFGIDFTNDDEADSATLSALVSEAANSPLMAALATAGFEAALQDVDNVSDAEEAVIDFLQAAGELGMERDQLLAIAVAAIPDDSSWAGDAEARFRTLIVGEAPEEDHDVALAASIAAEVADLSSVAALNSYAALLASDAESAEASVRRELLRERVSVEVAADTLAALVARIDDLDRDLSRSRARVVSTQAELEATQSRGLFNALRGFVDELGFGFGWASLYLTVFLSWWNGQTIGKKLLGLRVVRLDGEPITWWIAFERAGGYAAGFATGLLGFAQVYWDANRQGIHDRIVGTVVIRDGAERVTDWESAI